MVQIRTHAQKYFLKMEKSGKEMLADGSIVDRGSSKHHADGSAGAFFLAGIRGRGRFAGAAATGAFICRRGHVSQ